MSGFENKKSGPVTKNEIIKIYEDVAPLLEHEYKILSSGSGFVDNQSRSFEDVKVIFETLRAVTLRLYDFFETFPEAVDLFNHEFIDFHDLVDRSYILDVVLFGEFLFSNEQNQGFFHLNLQCEEFKKIDETLLAELETWITAKHKNHEDTEKLLLTSFSLNIRSKDLGCSCLQCTSVFRTKIREVLFDECVEQIEEYKVIINDSLDDGIDKASKNYFQLRDELDQRMLMARKRLKRSSVNKLESQLKKLIEVEFCYPSVLCIEFSKILVTFCKQILRDKNLRSDLVDEGQYERFFRQLGQRIWREKAYISREFEQLVKSALLIKRKDISSKILKDYLGQFWLHSVARKINRKIVYHAGPTNSGKTYHAIEALAQVKTGCYLAPLRLLAAELYDTLNQKGVATTLLTGEEVIEIPNATHYSSTVEMAKTDTHFDCCVIDEIQMIADPQRGWAWTRALINMSADEVHICGDDSVLELVKDILVLTGDNLEVRRYERMTELKVMDEPLKMGDLAQGDALIVFSRKNALKYKRDLEQIGFRVSIVYGRLSPEVRREQARKFDNGDTDVIVSTDAIAMGMNLPIQRIIFSTISKFIDTKEYKISASEVKQISGRAGRFGRFPVGYVSCLTRVEGGLDFINKSMAKELLQNDKAMVGPDLEIFRSVNSALKVNNLPSLNLPEFLRLFNTMNFTKPFYCVDLKEMIELAQMVEDADHAKKLSDSEKFGFSCAPVNLGLVEHVQYYVWILNHFANEKFIKNEEVDVKSRDIDYLETSIKCVELYQWLARHFNKKNFLFDEVALMANKALAVESLNELLSEKTLKSCSSCGAKLSDLHQFHICDDCFKGGHFRKRPVSYRPRGGSGGGQGPSSPRNGKSASLGGAARKTRGSWRNRKKG